jgi:hypothetical protein
VAEASEAESLGREGDEGTDDPAKANVRRSVPSFVNTCATHVQGKPGSGSVEEEEEEDTEVGTQPGGSNGHKLTESPCRQQRPSRRQ